VLLVALPLATGAALLVHLAISVALPLGIGLSFAGAIGLAALTWRRLSPELRVALRRRAILGIGIGVVSTLAYDATRLVLVWAVGFQFNPLETIRVFGQLLVGPSQPAALVFAAGALYHGANGIGFATALLLFVRRPGLRHGLAWAFILEAIMVSLYPGWLNLAAVDEFVSVSVVGHVVYGATLGILARRLVGTDALNRGSNQSPVSEGRA
jgi:hypothetical protein